MGGRPEGGADRCDVTLCATTDQGLLPGREGHVGVTAKDNRLFVEAVLWRYHTGSPWRDLPERFGDWKNTHRRFSRWAESGIWYRIFKHLAEDADTG